MKTIILIGGGGHCRSCIDVIESVGGYAIKGILDIKEKVGSDVLGYPVLGTDDDILKFSKDVDGFLVTLGQIKSPYKRIKIFEFLKDHNLLVMLLFHLFLRNMKQFAIYLHYISVCLGYLQLSKYFHIILNYY